MLSGFVLISNYCVMSDYVIWIWSEVSISLGAVVTLQNDSLSEMVKLVLQNVQIPLDKVCVESLYIHILDIQVIDLTRHTFLKVIAKRLYQSELDDFPYTCFTLWNFILHIANFKTEIRAQQLCLHGCQTGFIPLCQQGSLLKQECEVKGIIQRFAVFQLITVHKSKKEKIQLSSSLYVLCLI